MSINYLEKYTNVELEQGVMRKIFDEPQERRIELVNLLHEEWFFDQTGQKVVRALKLNPLQTLQGMSKTIGIRYSAIMDWSIPIDIDMNRSGVEQGIKEIHDLWRARQLYFKVSQTVSVADDPEALKEIYKEVEELLKEESIQNGGIEEQIKAYEKEIKSVSNVSYPFPSLQNWSGGLRNGQVHVIGGESGTGKSLFALGIAIRAVLDSKKVLFFSTEMTQGANLSRAILIFQSYCNLENIEDAINITSEAHNFITFDRIVKVEDMIAEIAKQKDVDLVVIDHLQDIDMSKYEKQYDAISNICGQIKNAAIDYDIPILLVSQLNRSSGRKNFDQERFLGSGKINQVAHLAMILESKKNDKGEELPDKILHIVKNRGVAGLKTKTGKIDLKFDDYMRFVEIDTMHMDVDDAFNEVEDREGLLNFT